MAIKKFPHAVIFHGVLYPAHTPIEVKEKVETKQETVKPTKKAVAKNDKRTGRKA